jgi:hypothetical protein
MALELLSSDRYLCRERLRGDIKRKLVWAAQHFYLFRHQCARYLEEQKTGTTDVNPIDDLSVSTAPIGVVWA